ncbi:MAG: peptidylprolyl isomerase [Motiliproteus sp.]|nr:peptidylprolyl isomerase [Motiliproteus sp.]MCW9053928.1 peptidylprolyl isomerase [Motiliproteus sp.]
MQISDKKVASINYNLKNDAGELLDSSEGAEPLVYLQGAGNIIPGLEKALESKQVGDTLEVTIAPEEAYGPVHEEMIQTVPRDAFDGVEDIDVGMSFQAETANGPVSVVVVGVEEDTVTVDGNHPLAGQTLHFYVEVVEVREASAEELQHGHVHGPGCNH